MNPQLLSSLATEHRRDLETVHARRAPAIHATRRARPLTIPRFRVSWSRTTLGAVAGSRRGSSVVIVISATRAS